MYDYYKLGGEGLISVVANAIPQETQKLFDLVQKDDTKTAESLRDQILSLLNDLGVDVNPIPIKLLTSELGFGQYEVRLPLVTLDERSEEHTSELQSRFDLVCRLLLEKKKNKY